MSEQIDIGPCENCCGTGCIECQDTNRLASPNTGPCGCACVKTWRTNTSSANFTTSSIAGACTTCAELNADYDLHRHQRKDLPTCHSRYVAEPSLGWDDCVWFTDEIESCDGCCPLFVLSCHYFSVGGNFEYGIGWGPNRRPFGATCIDDDPPACAAGQSEDNPTGSGTYECDSLDFTLTGRNCGCFINGLVTNTFQLILTPVEVDSNCNDCSRAGGAPLSGMSFSVPVRSYASGPGTELKNLLEQIGLSTAADCGCNTRAAQMDRWGVDACILHRDIIIGWIREAAQKAKWYQKLKAFARGYWSIESLVDEAIRRAANKL